MKRPVVVAVARVLLVGTALSLLLLSCRTPDISNLAERSAVGRVGDDANAAFGDILNLRETRDSEAIPALERILADHAGSLRIHGYAAAQALFCIDMPEAHAILKSRLLSSQYAAYHGINYVFHWDMDEERRDSFIERYHLRNLSKNLALRLDAIPKEDKERRWIVFTLTMRNTSDASFQLPDREMYLGSLLYLRSRDGRYARTFTRSSRFEHPPKFKWIELKPGGVRQIRITVNVRRVDEADRRQYHLLYEHGNLVLDTDDVAFDIVEAGGFSVCAMLEVTARTATQFKVLGCTNPWTGRAVSEPVEVRVVEPMQ